MLRRLLFVLALGSGLWLSAAADTRIHPTLTRMLSTRPDNWPELLRTGNLNGDDLATGHQRLRELVSLRDYAQAMRLAPALDAAAAQMVGSLSGDGREQIWLAVALTGDTQFELADQLVANRIRQAPGDDDTSFMQGAVLSARRPAEAAKLLEKALAGSLSAAYREKALQFLGTAYLMSEEFDRSRAAFKACLRLNSNNAFAKDALRTLADPALTRSTPQPATAFDQAEAAFQAGKFQEAVRFYDQALAENPRHVKALVYKGDALLALGDLDGAIGCYRGALKLDGRDKQALRFLGDTLMRKHDKENGPRIQLEEAVRCFEAALKVDPSYEMARQSLAQARAALQAAPP